MGASFNELRQEKGFIALMYLTSYFGGEYSIFIFLVFLISLVLKVKAMRLFNSDINVGLLVYFSTVFMIYDINGLRQGLAISLVMLSGWCAYKRYPLMFMISVGVAISMHIASVVAVPLYFIDRQLFLRKKIFNRILLLLASILLCISISSIIYLIPVSKYFDLIGLEGLGQHYNFYLSHYSAPLDIIGLGVIQRLLLMAIVLFLIDGLDVDLRLKRFLFNCQCLSLLLYFILSFNTELMVRISFYYKCFDIITLGLLAAVQKTILGRFLFLFLLTSIALIQIYRLLSIPDGGTLPYNNLTFQLFN